MAWSESAWRGRAGVDGHDMNGRGSDGEKEMTSTSMHLAVGMACGGLAAVAFCLAMKRGWRWIPLVMTAGAIWAILPDLPAMMRQQLAWMPLSQTLGSQALENALASWGNVFFFHSALASSSADLSVVGFALMFLLFNLSMAGVLMLERRLAGVHRPMLWDGKERRASVEAEAADSPTRQEGYRPTAHSHEQHRRMHQVRSSHLSRLL